MVSFSSYSALGTSIETGEIGDGQVTTAKIADGNVTRVKLGSDVVTWELLETLSFSADATLTTAALPARSLYKIVFKNCVLSADTSVFIQVNGITGAVYYYLSTDATGAGVEANNQVAIGAVLTGNAVASVNGELTISGITKAIASGELMFYSNFAYDGQGGAATRCVAGRVIAGSAVQITDFTVFVTGQTITGDVEIFGR